MKAPVGLVVAVMNAVGPHHPIALGDGAVSNHCECGQPWSKPHLYQVAVDATIAALAAEPGMLDKVKEEVWLEYQARVASNVEAAPREHSDAFAEAAWRGLFHGG